MKNEKQEIAIEHQQNTPMALMSQAVANNTPIEQLEKLMDLQDRFEKKEAQKAFFVAMNQFQGNKPDILKQSTVAYNGQTKFKFASLAKIQKGIDPVLSRFGLSYSFKQKGLGGVITVSCVVSHIDGHSEITDLDGEHDKSGGKNAIQSVGSAVSYLKRYTLMNAFGLSSDDDDGASTQMTPDEVNQMMLEKLEQLSKDKAIEVAKDASMKARLNLIIENKESTSYKKAIKILDEL